MAIFNFDTITAAQAAAFDPSEDRLVFGNNVSASAVIVAFGGSTTSLTVGARTVTLGATPGADLTAASSLNSENFLFGNGTTLFLGSTGTDSLSDLTPNNSAAYGNRGNDTLATDGSTGVLIQGNQGDDTLSITVEGQGTVLGGMDGDTINLTTSVRSEANGNMGDDTITVSNGSVTVAGAGHFVRGGQGNDTINVSGSFNHTILGDLGDDQITVTGGAGNHTIFGGEGFDTIVLNGTGNLLVNGNEGNDTITYNGTGRSTIQGGQGNDSITIDTASGTFLVSGDNGDDTITFDGTDSSTVAGSAATGTVLGGLGNDVITILNDDDGAARLFVNGNEGDDVITVTIGDAGTVAGGLGAYTIRGGQGDDVINATGSVVGLELRGDAGNDTITGGAGNDTIYGGVGRDVLTGGDGDDTFVLSGQLNVSTGGDLILDFDSSEGGGEADVLTFGTVAGTTANYRELLVGGNTSFEGALNSANALMDGTVAYVLVAGVSADYDGDPATANTTGGGILFADLNGDGTADAAVRLAGVDTLAEFSAADIIAGTNFIA